MRGIYYLLCINVFIIYMLILYNNNNIPYDLSSNNYVGTFIKNKLLIFHTPHRIQMHGVR